jgi:hypothetical protein
MLVDSGALRSPVERRAELKDLKTKLHDFNAMKTQQVFFGKRDRIIKNGWRHGIFGVEDPDSTNPSVFYKETLDKRNLSQHEKQTINVKRSKSKSFSLF